VGFFECRAVDADIGQARRGLVDCFHHFEDCAPLFIVL